MLFLFMSTRALNRRTAASEVSATALKVSHLNVPLAIAGGALVTALVVFLTEAGLAKWVITRKCFFFFPHPGYVLSLRRTPSHMGPFGVGGWGWRSPLRPGGGVWGCLGSNLWWGGRGI